MTEWENLTFAASDGYQLAGRHYKVQHPKGTIVVASATGVPQRFYQKFALRAMQHQFSVVTFDYRGIADSAPPSLKGFKMDYRDWAQQDLNGVIATLAEQQKSIYLVGHSYGGHAIGLMDNHIHLRAAYTFGTGAGWHGWMPGMEKWRVALMWNVIAPVLTRLQGYLGWSILGMGEDLPLDVYKQWKRWCQFPHYFFSDPAYPDMAAKFETVRIPIKAVNAIDDKWAMPRSRDAFMRYYRNAQLTSVDLEPAQHKLKSVGHMGYFFGAASGLWSDVFDFFEQHQLS